MSHVIQDILTMTLAGYLIMPHVFMCRLFTMFDYLADYHKVHKIDTAGDCYIAAGGITGAEEDEGGFYEVMKKIVVVCSSIVFRQCFLGDAASSLSLIQTD
jgi:predicted membrane protein